MKLANHIKRLFSALLVAVMVMGMLPVSAFAATGDVIDAAIFCSDVHGNPSSAKSVFNAIKNADSTFNPSTASFVGDLDCSTSTMTSNAQAVFSGMECIYSYGSHDSGYITDFTGVSYGADHDKNYYIYSISQSSMQSSSPSTSSFTSAVAAMDKTKPLFILSHMPLHARRGDNKGAAAWYSAISAAAEQMDIVFFWAHNHTGENSTDTNAYYVAKDGSETMSIQGGSTVTPNFTYMNAGYIDANGQNPARKGIATTVKIYADALVFQDYNSSGVYNGTYAHNVEVVREFASSTGGSTEGGETTDPETPVDPETPETPEEPEEPETPEVGGTIWRQATSITAGKNYMLVNYGYNDSGIDTYAVNSSASPVAVTVNTDDTGAYIVNDDQSLVWSAAAKGSQFTMANAETGAYLRAASSASGTRGANISTASSFSNSNYAYWSLETKSSRQVLSVRRSGSSSYYPVRYTGSAFQSFNSSQVSSQNNWLAVFVETDENAHTHSYTAVVTAPTCTEDGYTTYTCACGDSYTGNTVAALGHSYSCVETAATCTEKGSRVYTCATCAHTYTETIAATGHSNKTVTVQPTCTEDGSVITTCTICGLQTVEVLKATGHSYAAVVTAPTCTEDGYTTYTCACGESYTADIVAALGHSYSAVTTEPTCVTEGKTVYTCACGESYTEVIPATGEHEYTAVVTAPTCTEDGYTTYTCDCGESYTADIVAALGHSYSAVTTEPTCVTEGKTVYTCACGETYTEVIPATGEHEYTVKVTKPTCVTEGKTVYTCACGDSYIGDTVAALGHSYTAVTTAPTCVTEGKTVYTCACGESYTEVIPATGEHEYTPVVTKPTCTEDGYTTYACDCGDSYVADTVAALGHEYTAVVTAPTCTEDGYTTYTCACGDSYVADTVAALGHEYTAETTEPTCTEDGYTTHTCAACGDSYITDTVAAAGHGYTAAEVDGYLVYTCAFCGHSYSEKLPTELVYIEVSGFSNGRHVITLVSGNKYYALSHKDNTISAVQVTVSDGVITSEVTDDLVWDYSGNMLSYESSGTTYYLYAQPASGWWAWFSTPTLTISTSHSTTVSLSSNKLKMSNYYLRYSNGAISLNRSGTTAGLFAETVSVIAPLSN